MAQKRRVRNAELQNLVTAAAVRELKGSLLDGSCLRLSLSQPVEKPTVDETDSADAAHGANAAHGASAGLVANDVDEPNEARNIADSGNNRNPPSPATKSPAGDESSLFDAAHGRCRKVTFRPVAMQEQTGYQATFHFADRVVHQNSSRAETVRLISGWFAVEFSQIVAATATEERTWFATPTGTIKRSSRSLLPAGVGASVKNAATGSVTAGNMPADDASGENGGDSQRNAPGDTQSASAGDGGAAEVDATVDVAHNRASQHLIPDGVPCGFLFEMGVMSRSGTVHRSMHAKFRQINRYIEFIHDVVAGWSPDKVCRVVDFGCGKSYLTFATHHLFANVLNRGVNITGLDRKRDVIERCTEVAERLGCEGLEFKAGNLQDFVADGAVDLAISLHACDTATDAAIAAAIQWPAKAIFAVPCCQHELAAQIESTAIPGLTRHGIIRQRLASDATDALRSLVLEACGYRTQVLEFIELEHTPKNLLIRATAGKVTTARRQAAVRDYFSLMKLLGLKRFALTAALGDHWFKVLKQLDDGTGLLETGDPTFEKYGVRIED